ncbi:MAG: bestrophin family protein [Myxococcota bacterium]
MIVKSTLPIWRIIWSLKHSLGFFLIVSLAACGIYHFEPWAPDFQVSLTVIGLALSIFLGNRIRVSYDRWWEGRKLWGRMINRSRIITRQFLNFIEGSEADQAEITALHKRLVLRHIAYVHVFRVAMRKQSIPDDEDCVKFLTAEELQQLSHESNPCNALVQLQGNDLQVAAQKGWVTEHRLQQIDHSMVELLDVQGGCERILKTVIPTNLTYFPTRLVFLYGILLSIGLVKALGWWTIPTVLMVGFIFRIIDLAGKLIENPFTTFYYGLPLYAISRTIESNLLDRIDQERRPVPGPVDGVLM